VNKEVMAYWGLSRRKKERKMERKKEGKKEK
jgi:hypothetical protein